MTVDTPGVDEGCALGELELRMHAAVLNVPELSVNRVYHGK